MKAREQSKDSESKGGYGTTTDGRTIRDSMEYYRLWIFSSNAVLGLTSAIFIVFGAFVIADARLSLLRDVELYHPTFLYAYVALLLQCGLLQVIGCLGAKNLSEKLLSLYWASLLILTLGDIVVGFYWVVKLDTIKTTMKGHLGEDFLTKYSVDTRFTEVWNRVQAEDHCCGVNGPQDFNRFLSSIPVKTPNSNQQDDDGNFLPLPDSCCTIRIQEVRKNRDRRKRSQSDDAQHHVRHHHKKVTSNNFTSSGENLTKVENEVSDVLVPFQCRHLPKHSALSELLGLAGTAEPALVHVQGDDPESRNRVGYLDGNKTPVQFRTRNKVRIYRNGCAHKMLEWVEWVSGVLLILGFCILGFSKLCFLVILRREIKEMIEKIQMLRRDSKIGPPMALLGPLPYAKGRNSIHKQYSTQSGAMSTVSGVSMTGITIKSPSQYFATISNPVNHAAPRMSICDHYSHHHLDHYHHETRRHSARSLGTDSAVFHAHRKSQSQSQETVHLNLMISNHREPDARARNEAKESISFKVPTPEEMEVKRANWANQSPWEINVSGDSSVSGHGGYEVSSPPSSNSPVPIRRQQLVEVDMEKGPLSNASSLEEPTPTPVLSPETKQETQVEQVPLSPTQQAPPDLPRYHNANGNNNLDKEIDPDSDFVMALIGTPV